MKRRLYQFAFLFLFVTSFFTSCGKKQEVTFDQSENDRYVEAVSPSVIGRLTPVVISVVYEPKVPILEGISLSGNLKGSWEVGEDNRSAIFTPSVPYKGNSKITLSVDCKKLFGEGSGNGLYTHCFYVTNPKYTIDFDEVVFNETDEKYTVTGFVITDIPVSLEDVSKTLTAKLAKKNQVVTWSQSNNAEKWFFTIDDVKGDSKNAELAVSWSGKTLGVTEKQDKSSKGKKIFNIPSKNVFSIIDVNFSKEKTILVSFSKILDSAQDISSFIIARDADGKIKSSSSYNTTVRGNVLTLFSDSNFGNIQTVDFTTSIQAKGGEHLAQVSSVRVQNNWEKPEVKFMNSNVILPTTQGTVLPIETKNLSGVIIQAYAIHERNINQFLQSNELNETYSLARVGEPVWEKKINFDWSSSMQNKYVARGLDLSELVKKYPDGMFHIRISFRHDQIQYVCPENHGDFSSLPMPPDVIEPYSNPVERSSWDYWDSVNSNERNSYWSYRNDPCHPAFYISDYRSASVISRNILVSDLGILAKRDVDGKLYVNVADIRTAKPVSGIQVELKNYVGSLISTGKTNSDGLVVFNDSLKTYYVSATNGKQTSYLKISSGTSLSVSHFEIGGEIAENGVKGFIYGERGVWRPGDNIYLTFVLQDLEHKIPASIPVKFELIDPLGRVSESRLLTESVNGFYPVTTKTESDATTGLWSARVTVGGKTWTKNVSVEAVVPNRLSVELSAKDECLASYGNEFTLKSAWLHGAPTPNYKADVSVSYSEMNTSFDGYSEYTFTNPLVNLNSSKSTVWSGNLNSDSEANFNLSLNAGRNVPGMLKANFVTRVFEPAGGFSSQSKSFTYSPFDRYVGVKLPKGDAARNMLLTDTDHTVDVVLLDKNGKPLSGNLSYTVYKIEWKWWWEKDAYTDATYVSSSYYNRIASGYVDVKNGKGSFTMNVKYPDWGRYLVEVKDGSSGHSAGKICYIDWPGWAGRAQEGGTGSAAMVPLVTDKKQYSVGETAEISFASNKDSRALITLESSGEVLKQEWVSTSAGTTVYKIPLTQNMSPNIYVHVTLLQPHLQTANSLPIRLYGVVPVIVDNPKTKLTPVITSAESFEPGKNATFSVSEANGRPMTYTIAVVDEGLLGITNFHAADLRSHFYKKEASQLSSWDIYRYVMSAYSGKLETILAIGGSEEIDNDKLKDQNRFTPVVKYFGPFTLAAGEKKSTTFEMPQYIGAVRAIVVAGNDGAYGSAEKTVTVKSDLMNLASVPRTLGTNETVDIPVTVFNGKDSYEKANVTFKVSGAVNSSLSQSIEMAPSSETTLVFTLTTKKAGTLNIETIVATDTITSKSDVEVKVEGRGIPVSYRRNFMVEPGKTVSESVSTPGEKESTVFTVELSTLPQIDLTERLSYLTSYPHGCIEQITSGGFPQLFVPSYVTLSPNELNRIKENVDSVITRYSTYQTMSGGMGYWPGNTAPHSWGTCYSTHFMLEAKKNGYDVPSNLLNPALEWLSETAAEWTTNSNDSEATQAYRLFVLALAAKSDIGAMNRLASVSSLSNEARLLLAAAYAQCGRGSVAKDLIRSYTFKMTGFRSLRNDFESSIREQAIYMFTTTLCDMNSESGRIARNIADVLSSGKWLSTQECAWSLYSLLPYYINNSEKNVSYELKGNIGGFRSRTVEGATSSETLVPNYNGTYQNATIKNTSDKVLYGTLIASGMSVPGTERVQNDGLEMKVSGLSSYNTYNTGDNVSFTVSVTNNTGKKVENIALTVPVPTCFEFSNERIVDSSSDSTGGRSTRSSSRFASNTLKTYTYQDIRDDAIYTYFDLNDGQTAVYTFNATVAYTGNFFVPAIKAEAMYDSSIVAVNPGFYVKMK